MPKLLCRYGMDHDRHFHTQGYNISSGVLEVSPVWQVRGWYKDMSNIVYRPTKRGVFVRRKSDQVSQLAMELVGFTVVVYAYNTTLDDNQIRAAAMAWYPSATGVEIRR